MAGSPDATQVRALGMDLGLPESLVWRQPFPGPGLAIRVLCVDGPYMTPAYDAVAAQLTAACASWEGPRISPALLPVRTVGVQGDGRSYSYLAALSMEGSADAHWPALLGLAKRIPGSVHEVRRATGTLPCSPARARLQPHRGAPAALLAHACSLARTCLQPALHTPASLLTRACPSRSTASSSCWESPSPSRRGP